MRTWWLPVLVACGGGGGSSVSCEEAAQETLVPCGSPGELRFVTKPGDALADGCTHMLGGVHVPDAGEESLELLGDLRRIDERLSIFRGTHTTLEPLSGLRFVGGELSVRITEDLATLDGLGGLCEVGALLIEVNFSLEDLDGLSSLRRVHGDVTIAENQRLSTSEIDAFLARIEVGGTITVRDNGE